MEQGRSVSLLQNPWSLKSSILRFNSKERQLCKIAMLYWLLAHCITRKNVVCVR